MNIVREIRKEQGLSQEVLAARTNISRKYLSTIEKQAATPSIDIAIRISGALNVPVDKILWIYLTEKLPNIRSLCVL